MLTERGANAALSSAAVTDELLADAAILLVSGYSILDGFGVRGVRDLHRARAASAGRPGRGDARIRRLSRRLRCRRVPRRRRRRASWRSSTSTRAGCSPASPTPDRVARELATMFERAVLTVGVDGVIVIERGTGAGAGSGAGRPHDRSDGSGRRLRRGLPRALARRPATWSRPPKRACSSRPRAIMVMGGRPPV